NFGYLGFTQPEYFVPPGYIAATSFIELRNDYSLYGGNYNNYPKVTTAHEFFHAVQFGYDEEEMEYVPSDTFSAYHPYWMELTAVWMEDQVYPTINDYVNYLPYFYNYPWLSLKAFTLNSSDTPRYFHAYAACVWAFYLSKRFGTNVIKNIWIKCGQVQGDNVLPATDATLASSGSSLNSGFREFSIWNYFTNSRADTSNYYSEGNLFPAVKVDPGQQYSIYPVNVASAPHPPEVLGTNYVEFTPDLSFSPDNLTFYLNGSDSALWKASIVGYSTVNPEYFAEIVLDSLQVGRSKVNNWGNYSKIMMIPAVVTTTSGSFNYSYAAFKCGDANTSGNVNAADIVYLVSYLFKHGFPPTPLQSGDANSDGAVNASDIVYLVSYLFKHGPAPCG
ncbi:MAG TPA: dockerin type I domain-containing protein, partial [Terriglobales bacterium]|nr:dockerin type I domain-containing protein [Terriglobales bacterium]